MKFSASVIKIKTYIINLAYSKLLIGEFMKAFIAIVVLSVIFISCESADKDENSKTKLSENTLIPKTEYLEMSKDCSDKLMSYKLIEQMSVKKYLFKNNGISEAELIQQTIIYFEEEPTVEQKELLTNNSAQCNWDLWTPPADNHPLGFVTAVIPINNFEDIVCLDFVKKIDTGEREISPDYMKKLNNIK